MPYIIGTSGWQYRSWKDAFYGGRKQADWLEHYVKHFITVEVNNAFYRLPERKVFEQWAERTPDDFIVGVKMSRYLSHIKRLKEPEEPVARFLDRATGLGDKLGPVLLQLPPNLQLDFDNLRRTLELIPRDVKVSVEFRHETWYTPEVRSLLEERDVALCLYDSPNRTGEQWRTASWGYMRFHEGAGEPHPCYSGQQLAEWRDVLTDLYDDGDDVYVFFNNDPNVCAIKDAGLFGRLLEADGRPCTRYPDPDAVDVTWPQ